MASTRYSYLETDELLSKFDNLRQHSAVIEELCLRIEETSKSTCIAPNVADICNCPVCDAKLSVSYDEGNNLFDLRIAE